MYLKSQVNTGYTIQKVHGDDLFVRNDTIGAYETCSDVAFRDIWGNGKSAGENGGDGCPLVMITENISNDCQADETLNVVVVYFLNEHACLQAVVCDTVVYILSDEGRVLDIYTAQGEPE